MAAILFKTETGAKKVKYSFSIFKNIMYGSCIDPYFMDVE